MRNQGKATGGKEAEAPVRGAVDTSRPAPSAPPDETIRTRAYQLYREREGRGGDATSDWLTAEREHRENLRRSVQPTPQTVADARTR